MRLGEVEKLGGDAQKKVIKLKVEGLSHEAIAAEINLEFKAQVTGDQVREYLRRNQSKTYDLIKEDKNFQNKLYKQYWNTMTQLTDINSEIVKLFYELRNNPELKDKSVSCPHCRKSFTISINHYGALLNSAKLLLEQIRHVDDVLGKIQKKPITVNYNYLDLSKKLTQIVPEMLLKLEKDGTIKVKKRKILKITNEGKDEDSDSDEDNSDGE